MHELLAPIMSQPLKVHYLSPGSSPEKRLDIATTSGLQHTQHLVYAKTIQHLPKHIRIAEIVFVRGMYKVWYHTI